MTFVDSHIHIDELADEQRARGLFLHPDYRAVIPGVTPEQSLQTRLAFQRDLRLQQAIALHPWWVEENPVPPWACARWRQVCELAAQPWAIAVGETGLDYLKIPRNHPLHDLVEQWFIAHIQLAIELDKPLIVHAVRCHTRIAELLRQHGQNKLRGVIHAFSGSLEEARLYARLNFFIGIGPPVTRTHSSRVRAAAAQIPDWQLLIETDAPAMTTGDRRPGQGICDDLWSVRDTVAELRQISASELAELTATNARQLFGDW
jgi:TatD DNase family protein